MNLLNRLFSETIYVQLSPERLVVRNPRTGATLSEPPELALVRDPKPRIMAVGKEAARAATSPGSELLNPFAHPRSMVSDFTLGEQVMKAFFKRMQTKSRLSLAPRVVLHLLGDPAGGFTQVEIRTLHEMAIGAGAGQVTLWQGAPISDQQLLSGTYPTQGSLLS